MTNVDEDFYSEPEEIDVDTLAKLGPLRPLAGIWEGNKSLDVNPKAEGPVRQPYVERIELQPIDPQANGPQLFYGLRYHTHIVKPGEIETYHDQVGYWLWEPATETVILSLAISRAQVALAVGHASPNATTFAVTATRGKTDYGICSNPFLNAPFGRSCSEWKLLSTTTEHGPISRTRCSWYAGPKRSIIPTRTL